MSTSHHYISGKQYLNFSFSSNGYELLLRENMYTNDMIFDTKILTWIHYYKDDGTHIIGASIEELRNMDNCEDLIMFYEYNEDEDKRIKATLAKLHGDF